MTGTMCLTEPHCDTDLGMLRTKATTLADEGGRVLDLLGRKVLMKLDEASFASTLR